MDSFSLDGIRITSSSLKEMKDYLRGILTNNIEPKLLITFNLDFFRISSEDTQFYNACTNADMILPDGMGIVHLIKLKYKTFIHRITGNDLFELTLQLSDEFPVRIACVGSTPEILEALKKKAKANHPNVQVVAAISPQYLFEQDALKNEEVISELAGLQPDALFLALGCPRQELWLRTNMYRIGAKVNVGVGATFDFYAGYKKRSPRIFQLLSMEWLWRLLSEPGRLYKRYLLKDIPFFFKKIITIKFK